ncbi:MAG: CotH kinase family protein [Oscillospiraceae bacterium]|nr:CotH kinase family protein [Oscillospiraceae bacterium]
MKTRFLSTIVLFAMLASILVADVPFLGTGGAFLTASVSADGPDPVDDDDDEDPLPTLILRFYHNGVYVGENYNRFVSAGDKITVRAGYLRPLRVPEADGTGTTRARDEFGNGLNEFVVDPTAEVYYTHNSHDGIRIQDELDLGRRRVGTAIQAPATTSGSGPIAQGVQVGTDTWLANRVFLRHFGGHVPERATNTNKSTRFPLADGLTVPARVEGSQEMYTISVVAYRGNEEARDTQSFMLIPSNNARVQNWDANNFLVFSVFADSNKLYDHRQGILVAGIEREDWIVDYQRLNPTGLAGTRPDDDGARSRPDFVAHDLLEPFAPTLPANFNRRGRPSEVAAFVEILDPKGVKIAGEGAGMRVKGGWSRGTNLYEQRTFEFYFRDEYNEYDSNVTNRISFPLFGEQHSDDGSGNIINRYRRFRVRNGGSDRDRAYIRDELAATLFRQAGMMLTQKFRPAVVFLNGGYYGMTFMKMPRTENHWAREVGGNNDNFVIIQNGERAVDGCNTSNETCGRIIPFQSCSSGCQPVTVDEATHASGCRVSTRRYGPSPNASVGNVTGHGVGMYQGFAPPVCSGSRSCAAAEFDSVPGIEERREVCASFATTGDDYCDGVRNAAGGWEIQPHRQVCFKSNSATNPGNRYGSCTGCRGTCDWADMIRLIEGQHVRALDGTDLAGGNTNSNSNTIRANLNGFTGANGQQRWEEFKLRVDVDYLIHYYALNMWGANEDWPGNNMEWWRYFPDAGEQAQIDAGTLDYHRYLVNPETKVSQWRPVPQDLEMGYSIWSHQRAAASQSTMATANTLQFLLDRGNTPGAGGHYGAGAGTFMMRGLLGSDANPGTTIPQDAVTTVSAAEMRTKLANAYADIFGGSHSATNAQATFAALRSRTEAEHRVMLDVGSTDNNGNFLEGHQGNAPGTNPNRRVAEIHRSSVQSGIAGWAWPNWGIGTGPTDPNVLADLNNINVFLGARTAALTTHLESTLLNDRFPGGSTTWSARNVTVDFGVVGPSACTAADTQS